MDTPSTGVAATYHGAAVGALALAPPPPMARSLKRYSRPLVSPVMVWDVMSGLSLGVDIQALQADPDVASRYWYWYQRMSMSMGRSHARVTRCGPPPAVRPVGAGGGGTGG